MNQKPDPTDEDLAELCGKISGLFNEAEKRLHHSVVFRTLVLLLGFYFHRMEEHKRGREIASIPILVKKAVAHIERGLKRRPS